MVAFGADLPYPVDKGDGTQEMEQRVDRLPYLVKTIAPAIPCGQGGRGWSGVQISESFADVIYGWSLTSNLFVSPLGFLEATKWTPVTSEPLSKQSHPLSLFFSSGWTRMSARLEN